ncbi:MAG TPA: orotidine-5'-phosphate decarboxylase [Candidatus Limnocylindrales bacterium]|nr:orotidine-5'-phosphate decarboxylase [Candidatus Limnocylindrales bacterium]
MGPALARLEARIEAVDSMLCVGLDSAVDRMPERFRSEARPQLAFDRWIIDETHPYAAAYKANMAFYEARGAAGWQELREAVAYLRSVDAGIFAICDAKRGDIDATNTGYVTGLLDELGFDAITLHPYLGAAALRPFLERADKACIVLCRTSNPGAGELQDLEVDGVPLWEVLAIRVRDEWDARGNCMLVMGATYPEELRRARELCPDMPFLVPGIGAQGGDVGAVVRAGLDRRGRGLLMSASRSIIGATDPASEARALRDAIREAASLVGKGAA